MDNRRKQVDGVIEVAEAPTRPSRNPYGVFLRSTRSVSVRVQMQQKHSAALQELGIPDRPRIPTEASMKKNDELRSGIISILDIKKQTDRLDHEIKVCL